MCASTADHLNRRLRDFLMRRNHRALTEAEKRRYEQLRGEWIAAERRELPSRQDVTEAA